MRDTERELLFAFVCVREKGEGRRERERERERERGEAREIPERGRNGGSQFEGGDDGDDGE